MKAEDIIRQLQIALPVVTDLFTDEVDVVNLTDVGGTITATTAEPHGLSTGTFVSISNVLTENPITSLSRTGKIATAKTKFSHDLTLGFHQTVNITGATQAGYNGDKELLSVQDAVTFSFTVDGTTDTPATGDIILNEDRLTGYNGRHKITVINDFTFTYLVTTPVINIRGSGDIKARFNTRISGAVSVERAIESYTRQKTNELWGYVVLGDMIVSKDRNIDSDSTTVNASGDVFRQRTITPFDIFAVAPATGSISGRQQRDLMQDVAVSLWKSILRVALPTGLTEKAWSLVTATGHGFAAYVNSYYVHRFSFETTADITFCDTIGPSINSAFRELLIDFTNPALGNDDIIMTADIKLP